MFSVKPFTEDQAKFERKNKINFSAIKEVKLLTADENQSTQPEYVSASP